MSKKCMLCEDYEVNADEEICVLCKNTLNLTIGLKCLSCGTFGFIEKNETNIKRFEILIAENFKDMCECHQVTIIPMRSCPSCIDNFSGNVRSDLIH